MRALVCFGLMTSLLADEDFSLAAGRNSRDRVALAGDLLEHAWARGWFQKPRLEPGALLTAARTMDGLANFGDEDGWRDRLDRLCTALHDEARLNALGTTIAYGQIVAALAARLRACALWHRYPEIAEVSITAPIVVVGQMRSGSTRMQRLLACDPRFTFTRFFESWNPLPRWPRLPIDDRRARGWLALRIAHGLNPKFGLIHPARTRQADEEIGLHNISLYGAAFEAQWRIPSFARHSETLDNRQIYAEFRHHLQTIRWLRKDRTDKPWILKLPQFSQDLDAVLKTFPGARIVVLHRDPVSVVGSSASLVHNQMSVQSDHVDTDWIGQEWLRKVNLRQQRTAAARARHDPPSVDIAFADMQADWRGEMQRVYEILACPLTPEVERRMVRFMRKRGHGKLRRHAYDITDYGLSEEQVRSVLGAGDQERERAAA